MTAREKEAARPADAAPPGHPAGAPARSRAARGAYLALGLACVPLGVAGFWLPLVPGTVFLIVAAWAFSRSSPRLENWILSHPRLGPSVRAWREKGAIPRGVKGFTLVSMAVSMAIVAALGFPLLVVGVGGAACLATAAFVLTRPDA